MSGFRVLTGELTGAAGAVRSDNVDAARSNMSSASGAFAGNEAFSAFHAFTAAVETAITPMTEITQQLSSALLQAAAAYNACDQSIAQASRPGP